MAKLKYNENFPLMAEDFARQGMIDTQIAQALGVALSTYYSYQTRYPEFSEAIARGKRPVDVEVENALLKRSLGYDYEEDHVEYRPGKTTGKKKAGDNGNEESTSKPSLIKRVKKHVVPDVTAQKFWLINRRPERWREKQEYEHTVNPILSMSKLRKSLEAFKEDEARG